MFSRTGSPTLDCWQVEIFWNQDNGKYYKIPDLFLEKKDEKFSNQSIKEALFFNKSLLIENFISPNYLKIPVSRNLLENYY